jgi:uncharacterized membrane protein YdjX (TVP38/TMEM64 family)
MSKSVRIGLALAVVAFLLGLVLLTPSAWVEVRHWYDLLSDREWIRSTVMSFGRAAPLAFVLIQVAQVLAAPVPGEATGFLGGFIFGTLDGFIYSSIGLTIGSLINFGIGRAFGERLVRRFVSQEKFRRIDRLINHQGIFAVFIMFVIPGFPKDYLSLALGFSSLPLRLFVLIAGLGRMPGTLMLSLQGAALYDKNYGLLASVAGACLVLVLLAYRYRESLYRWVDKINAPRNKA